MTGAILTPEEMDRIVFGWDEAWAARLLALLVGGALLWFGLGTHWTRRGPILAKSLAIAAGVGALLFACIPQQVVLAVVRVEYMTRFRLIVAAVSLLVLLITLESIRKTHLSERYALLWVATALVLILAASFPRVVAILRALTGMHYAAAMICVVALFVMLVLFQFSVALSGARLDQTRLVQRVAILEARLRRLERAVGAQEGRDEGGSAGSGEAAS